MKQAKLSSDFPHLYAKAELAVDGKYGKDCQFVHTYGEEMTPWLRVELGGKYPVSLVIIQNRMSPENDRLSNSGIYVYDAEPDVNRRLCGKIDDGDKDTVYVGCSNTLWGRGVELLLFDTGVGRVLNICEIEVY